MPKLLFPILCFLFSLTTFSQTKGKVEYGLFIEKSPIEEDVIKGFKKAMGNDEKDLSWSEGAKKISFVLEFKNTVSKFYVIKGIDFEDFNVKIALARAKYENSIYLNSIEKKKYYNNSDELMIVDKEEFKIEENIYDSWELKSETKEIQGFICYKATGNFIGQLDKGEEKRDIIAWYCPELPFSFGPNGYGGLPGLILELQVGDVLFGATKISLNEKIEDIDSSKLKGKRITSEEYSKILRERAGVIMEGR